ncbi:hypothetical protein BI364_07920 [Acidihalobacter yilgarnensis]|uniref:histidine kinase n=1 Tax=Acidihalobacter yilgarnensis TaxID=2819280 RepID=A0A1D8IN51_9GAMM|nr:hypothetical protein BI364_07920 [Acidihalobacter yilgarnensis]
MSDLKDRNGYAPSGAMPAPLPPNEADRLDALRRFAVLDTAPESDLDEIAALASEICETPIALVSLVDEHRQWFKSRVGLDAQETPREMAFCAHAILGDTIFEIPDALEDPRFRTNPLVTSAPDIRFYAGMVLATSDGLNLGTLCVIDRVPRRLTERQRSILMRLARQVSKFLSLRLTLNHYAEQSAFQEALLSSAGAAIIACAPDGRITRFNATAERLLGYQTEEVIGHRADETFLPLDLSLVPQVAANAGGGCFDTLLATQTDQGEQGTGMVETRYRHADGREIPVLLSITSIRDAEGRVTGQLGVAHEMSKLKRVQNRLDRQQQALRVLNEIAAHPGDDIQAQLTLALKLGAEYLGMSHGIISRIVDEDFEVWAQVSPANALHEGQHFPLNTTYCSLVVGSSDVLAIDRMSASSFADHPCHDAFHMESYIGIPIWMEGEAFGALSFSSHDSKPGGFDEADRDFLRLLSGWLGSTLMRQREQAMRDELLARLQKLSAHVPGVVYQYLLRVDGTSSFPYASEGILDIYGVCPEAVREDASAVFAVIHAADVPVVRSSIERSARELTVWHMEYRVDHPQHGTIWVEGRATPERLLDGAILWHGVITDITARKIAQDVLDRERQRMVSIIEGTNAGTWEWNIQTGETVFNERWAAILGYRLEELSPTTADVWRRLLHPEDVDQAGKQLAAHFAGESPYYDTVLRMRHKQGHWVWVHARGRVVNWLAPGKPLMMYGTHADITESREQEEEIRNARAFLQAVIDSSTGVSVIATDTSGLITLFNSGAERLLGYKAEEIIGCMTPAPFHLESEVQAQGILLSEAFDKPIQGFEVFVARATLGEAETRQWTYVRQDGEHRQVNLTVTAIRDESDRITGFLGIASDITELVRTSDALQDSEQRFRGMVANLPGVVYRSSGDDGRSMRYMSGEIEQLAGYPVNAFLDEPRRLFGDLIHPDDRAMVLEALSRMRAGETCEYSYRLIHADGHVVWVYEKARGEFDQSGNFLWFDGFFWDITARRTIENELKLSQKRFSGAFATAPLGMALVSLDGRWLEVNDKLCQILGYERDDLLETDFQHITHPDDLDADLALVSQLLAGDVPSYQLEKRYLHRNGKIIWALLSVSLVRDVQGDPVHFVSQIEDFTSRKLAEEALLESEKKLSTLYRMSPVSIMLNRFDDGQFVEANPELFRLTGYEENEYRQLSYWDITPDEYAAQEQAQIESLRTRGVYGPYEKEYICKDGRRIPVLLNGSLIEGIDGEKYIWSIAQDISERVLAEQRAIERERYVQAVIDNVIDGIVTLDEMGCIESFNRAAERIFGYRQAEVLGLDAARLLSAPQGMVLEMALQTYRKTGAAQNWNDPRETEGVRRNGDPFPMELSLSEIRHLGHARFIAVVRDITARKRMQEMKDEFVATVSHELRTPLTSISGSLGLLVSDALSASPEKSRPLIEIAHKNSIRLTHLINDLLDMEKMAAGKMHFDICVQLLLPLVEQAIDANQSYADQYKVRLVLTRREANAWVNVDTQRLQQILANFISNAAKFSPPDSTVEISIHAQGENDFRIEVRDQGQGVPLAFQDHLFQKFAQADGSSARSKGGTGLGLAISKEMAERMGCAVGFDSIEGQGACFYIDLPRVPETAKAGPDGVTRFFPDGMSEMDTMDWILVVEDDTEVAVRVGLTLREAGFAVDLAFRGAEALAKLAERKYVAITLDLMLPDMNGRETLESVRHAVNERHSDVLIIVMSQLGHAQLGVECDDATIVWFDKPVDLGELISVLQLHTQMGKSTP